MAGCHKHALRIQARTDHTDTPKKSTRIYEHCRRSLFSNALVFTNHTPAMASQLLNFTTTRVGFGGCHKQALRTTGTDHTDTPKKYTRIYEHCRRGLLSNTLVLTQNTPDTSSNVLNFTTTQVGFRD